MRVKIGGVGDDPVAFLLRAHVPARVGGAEDVLGLDSFQVRDALVVFGALPFDVGLNRVGFMLVAAERKLIQDRIGARGGMVHSPRTSFFGCFGAPFTYLLRNAVIARSTTWGPVLASFPIP